jgi:hypothetical protein
MILMMHLAGSDAILLFMFHAKMFHFRFFRIKRFSPFNSFWGLGCFDIFFLQLTSQNVKQTNSIFLLSPPCAKIQGV